MNCAVIYMAAGNSRRFSMEIQKNSGKKGRTGDRGTNKLLQKLEGRPLFLHGLETLVSLSKLHPQVRVLVVTRYEEIFRAAKDRGAEAFLNPESGRGVSYTIRRGIREARRTGHPDYLLFVTADQPYLSLSALEQFLTLAEEGVFPVVSAAWRRRRPAGEERARRASSQSEMRLGNPVMFHVSLAEELERLTGDEGGRCVWRRYASRSGFVYVKEERELEDFDVPWESGEKGLS